MNEQTKTEYRKLAHHFYQAHVIQKPTAKAVCDALKTCAPNYRPAYWRRLRCALALVASEAGAYKAADQIRATKNPVTSDPKRRKDIKPKQIRQKSVSLADEQLLLDYLFEQKERAVFAAVTLVSHLGCRPSELAELVFMEGQSIYIPSAKKTSDGKRGLDRVIYIDDPALFTNLETCHELLTKAPYTDPIRYVQKRLAVLTQKLWPRRKVRPSLYSWRHQLGSDLKASKTDPAETAVIMGHRSVESAKVYGNPRSQRDVRSYLKPERSSVKAIRRQNSHRLLVDNRYVKASRRTTTKKPTQRSRPRVTH